MSMPIDGAVQAVRWDRAEALQVIRTTLFRRGDGKEDPIRVITQYWSFAGELLAEVDPVGWWLCKCGSQHPHHVGACPTGGQ